MRRELETYQAARSWRNREPYGERIRTNLPTLHMLSLSVGAIVVDGGRRAHRRHFGPYHCQCCGEWLRSELCDDCGIITPGRMERFA